MGPRAKAKPTAGGKRKNVQDVSSSKALPKKRGKQEEPKKAATKKAKATEEAKKPKSDYDRFMAEIKAREKKLDMCCVVLGTLGKSEDDEEEQEDKEPSMEELQALARVYVPKEFQSYYQEVAEQLFQVGCTPPSTPSGSEDEAPRNKGARRKNKQHTWTMRMLCTRHSYPMQDILEDSLKDVDKALRKQDWPDAFSCWAATVMAGRREDHWFCDTDVPEVAEAIYEKMRTQWVKLKKHSDKELGGLVAEGCESAKGEFEAYLQGLADEMQGLEFDVKDVVKTRKGKE